MGESFAGFPGKGLPSSVGTRPWEAAEVFPTERWKSVTCHSQGVLTTSSEQGRVWGQAQFLTRTCLPHTWSSKAKAFDC